MTNDIFDPEKTTRLFISAFADANMEALKNTMAADIKFYVTNAEGGVNLLDNRDAVIQNIEALDVRSVKPTAKITQLIKIDDATTMIMVEIHAKRKGKTLHNFAAYLIHFDHQVIKEIRMVEALPAYSDEFWKS